MRFNIQFPSTELRKSVLPLVANLVVVLVALWLVSDASLSKSKFITDIILITGQGKSRHQGLIQTQIQSRIQDGWVRQGGQKGVEHG